MTAAGFKPSARGIEDHLKPLKPTRSKAEFYVFQRPSPWEWVANEITNQGMNPVHCFSSGKREPVTEGWVTKPADSERRPPVDVLFPLIGPPIIHDRIAKKLGEMASHAVQLTPVEVLEVPPNSGPYVILNVLKRIACLNLGASKTCLFEGKLSWIIKGVIHRSRAQGEEIFVLDEYESWIVVSRRIKEMLEAEHVRGIQLIPIETSD